MYHATVGLWGDGDDEAAGRRRRARTHGPHGAASFRGAFGYPSAGRTRSHNRYVAGFRPLHLGLRATSSRRFDEPAPTLPDGVVSRGSDTAPQERNPESPDTVEQESLDDDSGVPPTAHRHSFEREHEEEAHRTRHDGPEENSASPVCSTLRVPEQRREDHSPDSTPEGETDDGRHARWWHPSHIVRHARKNARPPEERQHALAKHQRGEEPGDEASCDSHGSGQEVADIPLQRACQWEPPSPKAATATGVGREPTYRHLGRHAGSRARLTEHRWHRRVPGRFGRRREAAAPTASARSRA